MATKNLGRVVGKSAYEIWLEQGNTGTEQDFLDSLKASIGENELHTHNNKDILDNITSEDIVKWNSEVTVPTKISELYNDSKFATEEYVNNAITGVGDLEVSDEQIATAVQGWLDEHPEATTTVADGSIGREKLSFNPLEGELSSNLIDETKLTSARFTNENGTIQTFADGSSYFNSWRMTDFIDVSQHIGETISTNELQGYCFYDESKKAISGSGYGSGSVNKPSSVPNQVVIPEGAYYLRLVYWHKVTNKYQANYGEIKDVYCPYGAVVFPKNIIKNENIGEKISIENIENEKLVQLTFANDLINYDTLTKDITLNKNTGSEVAMASSLNYRLTDYIPVKPNTLYSCKGFYVYNFRADKSYISGIGDESSAAVRSFTTGEDTVYVRLSFKITGIDYQTVVYLVEGDTPEAISTERKHIRVEDLKDFSAFSSVLSRMKHLFNPTVKTSIGFIGDSNTAGLIDKNYDYYDDCWANLLVNKINTIFAQDIYIKVIDPNVTAHVGANFEETCWFDSRDGFVNLKFYGAICKVHYKGTTNGVMVLKVDDGEPIEVDVSADGIYEIEGLTEENHFLNITAKDTNKIRVQGFTIHKYVEAVNRGVSGESTRNLYSKTFNDNISVVVFGTNDRSSTQPYEIRRNLINYVKIQNKLGNSVILVTPTPAADKFETGESEGLKMDNIDNIIASTCAELNFEHISLYQYLLDYCDCTGTSLGSLFKDTLHMMLPAHKLVYTYLCKKLGLGRDIEDYLTTT